MASYLQLAGIRVINNPTQETAANNKLYQLATARQLGLRIPRTVVTNDPGRARAFHAERTRLGQRVIYKGLTQPRDRMVSTQLLGEADLAELDTLKLAPVIFQEYCEGRNLRAIVVGRELFVGEVGAAPGRQKSIGGWKCSTPCAIRLEPRPGRVGSAAHAKVRPGVWGSISSCCPRGELVFLEVNPAGQFLFVEIRPGYRFPRPCPPPGKRMRGGRQTPPAP